MKLIENARLLCVSTGSACKTLQATTSHVLKAMGYDEEEALSSFRISIGLNNTEDEMKRAADLIATTALELRRTSAV
jgi:cysteine desulfurase